MTTAPKREKMESQTKPQHKTHVWTVRLPRLLWERFSVLAADEATSAAELFRELIRRRLKEGKKKGKE